MKKRIVLVLMCLTFAIAFSAGQVSGANHASVGVDIGDRITYTTTSTGSFPYAQLCLNVIRVVGVAVTFNETEYYGNGSFDTRIISGDIAKGENGIGSFIVCPGLSAGDNLWFGSSVKVNSTKSMTILGTTRTINIVNITGTVYDYDQVTGIMVRTKNSTYSATITGVISALWTPPYDWSTFLVGCAVGIVVGFIVGAIIIYVRFPRKIREGMRHC